MLWIVVRHFPNHDLPLNLTIFYQHSFLQISLKFFFFISVVVMRFFFVLPPPSLEIAWRLQSHVWPNLIKYKEILEKLDDGVFVRTLQCLAAQQQKNQQHSSNMGKEPSLMPVPSPQQISYLNQFEGNPKSENVFCTFLERACFFLYFPPKNSILLMNLLTILPTMLIV